MGYFSNGTEGMAYQAAYCERCYHDREQKCAVWLVHLLYNGDQDKQAVLDDLIPQNETGCWNQQCAMFVDGERLR